MKDKCIICKIELDPENDDEVLTGEDFSHIHRECFVRKESEERKKLPEPWQELKKIVEFSSCGINDEGHAYVNEALDLMREMASSLEIILTTTHDPEIATEAKRTLKKFQKWK